MPTPPSRPRLDLSSTDGRKVPSGCISSRDGVLGMLFRDTSFDVPQSEGASEHSPLVTLLQQQQALDPRGTVS